MVLFSSPKKNPTPIENNLDVPLNKEVTRIKKGLSPLSSTPASNPEIWHSRPLEELLSHLQTDRQLGLRSEQYRQSLLHYGMNSWPPVPHKTLLELLGKNLKSSEMLMLLTSAGLSVLTGSRGDAATILGVVALNTSIGIKTEASIEKIIQLGQENNWGEYKVLREGVTSRIPYSQLVPGDIVLINRGQVVPADLRLLEVDSLTVDESNLTGESAPVEKRVHTGKEDPGLPLADRTHMLYQGTVVTGGAGKGLVVTTGLNTVWGGIQELSEKIFHYDSPLKRDLERVTLQLSKTAIGLSFTNFMVDLLYGKDPLRSLQKAITLCVAAIPEGLPLSSMVTLSYSVENLKKVQVLVRNMKSLESLGRVDVVCLDKTGTLTLDKMELSYVATNGHLKKWQPGKWSKGRKDEDGTDSAIIRLLEVCTLNSQVNMETLEGSSTEKALVEAAKSCGIDCVGLKKKFPKLRVFQRTEKKNHVIITHQSKVMTCKGRPDEVMALCRYYWSKGKLQSLTQKLRKEINKKNNQLSLEGLRVLGVAVKNPYWTKKVDKVPANEWLWLGLVALQDQLRPGVIELIQKWKKEKVKMVMITGDQHHTALAVAKRVGLIEDFKDPAYRFQEVAQKKGKDFHRCLQQAHVFSRVSPADKLKIVEAMQEMSWVVAMTGDGVNDAPALKKADIGIVMANGGNAAAKQAADIVIENPSLYFLYHTYREGRQVHQRIYHSTKYVLNTNLSEIIFQGLPSLFGLDSPLEARHLLWINLLTDLFPQIAMGRVPMEEEEQELKRGIRSKLRPLSSLIRSPDSWKDVGTISGVTLLSFLLGLDWRKSLKRDSQFNLSAKTMGFITANLAQLFYVDKVIRRKMEAAEGSQERTQERRQGKSHWKKFWPIVTPSLGLLTMPFLIPPVGRFLQLQRPPWPSSLLAGLLGLGPFLLPHLLDQLDSLLPEMGPELRDSMSIRKYIKHRRTHVVQAI